MPDTRTKAKSDTSLTEFPVIYISTMVTRKAKGIPMVVNAALRSPMNSQMMLQTRTIPSRRLTPRTRMESLMRVLESWVTARDTPNRS